MTEKRINVNLNFESERALAEVQARTGLSKVDIVNRAIVMYEFFYGEVKDGSKVAIRHQDEPDTAIRFF